LQWNVLASLITIFRDLRGGRLFGQQRDFAKTWQQRFLDDSLIVEDYKTKGFSTQFEYWREFDGPWRRVFVVFWNKIRAKFANDGEEETHNYWGRPRKSNLYNKISLTILAADFFQWLSMSGSPIAGDGDIPVLVKRWLSKINRSTSTGTGP
jgi:hypothetical protein